MKVIKCLKAADDTGKIIIELDDTSLIEAVLLEDQTGRITACLSSQVGCSQGCGFCKTSRLGLKRNLTTQEIIGQFNLLKESFDRDITNVVYMGMGEPLHNLDNVIKSLRYFTNPKTENIFLRRITISTSGVIKGITDLLNEAPYPGLAFSLISADEKYRKEIMPGSPSLSRIKEALLTYQDVAKKRIIIEIIAFDNKNNSEEEAIEIANYLKGLDVIINLIPFNPIDDERFLQPKMENVKIFSQYIKNQGLKVTIRHGKGQEIAGACGQLG